MNSKKRIIDIFGLLLTLLVIMFLLIWPEKISNGIAYGILICGNVLIPTLFPFTVLSLILTESNVIKKFGNSSFLFALSVIFLSAIGGYPIGAKIIAESEDNGLISKDFANKLILVSINAGPAFVITAVGKKILGSEKLGILLFVAHILSTIILFFVLRPYKNQEVKHSENFSLPFSDCFVNAVAKSSAAMIGICSYVILFSGIINLITELKLNGKTIISILEITNAVINNNNIYTISFYLGFSGLCIIMQVLSIGKNFIKKPLKIIIFRIIHGILSIINLKVLLTVFPQSTDVLSNGIKFTYKTVTQTTLFSLLLIALSVMFIYSLQKKKYCGKINLDIW